MLIRDEIVQEISTRAFPVQIIRHGIAEPAGVLVTKSASSDQESDGYGHGQDDREREGESLDDDFASELGEDVGKVRRDDLDEENVDWRGAVRTNFDVFLKELSSGDVRQNFSSSAKAVMDLGDVNWVPVKGGGELREEGADVSGVQVEEEEGAAEKEDDLPE